jgi:ribosomal protein S18 acetylase RimI-like enzyme
MSGFSASILSATIDPVYGSVRRTADAVSSAHRPNPRSFDMFETSSLTAECPALRLVWHAAPWDRPFFGAVTAAITDIALKACAPNRSAFDPLASGALAASSLAPNGLPSGALPPSDPPPAGPANPTPHAWTRFTAWRDEHAVPLVVCRLPHTALTACGFLEAQGFRFIELNVRPYHDNLAAFAADPDIAISPATDAEAPALIAMAAETFDVGRLHADPAIGRETGNRRYAAWLANAFGNPAQQVLAVRAAGQLAAFMVVETPAPDRRHWSLTGLAPGLAGQGLGTRIWRSMLARHHAEGVRMVETSISSHNTAATNLYARLGFRFPPPFITLHWTRP